MAVYEVPDALSLVVVEQRFPDKFLTPAPTPNRRGVTFAHPWIVCVPMVRRYGFRIFLDEAFETERGLYMMDKPTELAHLMSRDRADQCCAVCSRTAGEIEEKGCGYDPKKHR